MTSNYPDSFFTGSEAPGKGAHQVCVSDLACVTRESVLREVYYYPNRLKFLTFYSIYGRLVLLAPWSRNACTCLAGILCSSGGMFWPGTNCFLAGDAKYSNREWPD